MDFRSLLQSFNTISEAEGTVHKGTYGTSYGKEDVRDQYGHRVGKVDKEATAKKDEPKKGRGRPKKDGGEGAKFDTSALSSAFGSKKPSGKVGTVSKKHSLKEYIEEKDKEVKFKQDYRNFLESKGIEVTDEMLEEGWKSKLASLGTAAAIGATALGGMMGTQAGVNQHGAEYGAAAGGGGVGGSSFSQLHRAQSQVDAKADAFAKANPQFKQQLQQLRQQVDQKYGDSPMLQMQKQLEGTNALLAQYQANESLDEEELTIKPMPGASQIIDPEGEVVGTADAQTASVMKTASERGTLNIGQQMKEGKDEGKPGKNFKKIADKAAKEYGSKEAGERVAGAVKAKLVKQGKLEESLSFNEMSQEAQAEAQEMLAELQDDIENFVNTGHCSEKLEAFLKVHGHAKKKIADEGAIQDFTTHGMDSKPSKFVAVDPAQKPTPWKVDPIQATTDRAISGAQKAGSFIKNLVAPKKTFEGTDMKDIQVEGWEKQLNGLLTEGITVSSSQGQQGSPDSVSVTASDADAQQLLQVLRQAGLGVFGGSEQPTSNYGAPMAAHGEEPEGHGTEPEASPEVADVDDDIMSLIKKMTGIEQSGEPGQEQGGEQPGTLEPADGGEEEHGQDYEDEEGSEESGEEQGSEEESGEEEQTDEGNAFTGKLAQTKQGGEFKLGDKEYKDTSSLEEDDMEEGNMFTGNLAKARAQGKEQADLDNDGDMEKVREGEDACDACGKSPCGCDHEHVEENYANEPDEEMAKLKALLSMGNDMHRVKHSQAVGNPVRVAESNMINDWKKLSGIK
jgi:hypothetical protein